LEGNVCYREHTIISCGGVVVTTLLHFSGGFLLLGCDPLCVLVHTARQGFEGFECSVHRGCHEGAREVQAVGDAGEVRHEATLEQVLHHVVHERLLVLKHLVGYLSTGAGARLDHRVDDRGEGLDASVLLRALGEPQGALQGRLHLGDECELCLGAVVAGGDAGDEDPGQRRAILIPHVAVCVQQVVQHKRQHRTVLQPWETYHRDYVDYKIGKFKLYNTITMFKLTKFTQKHCSAITSIT